jgi:4-aminobutyrate aminotransferase-like enzyme
VEFVADASTKAPDGALVDRLVARSADLGLLVLSCGPQHQVVRFIPPLDVSATEVSEALEIFGEALRTV